MSKRKEKVLLKRYQKGDHQAAFELAHLLASTYQYSRYKEIIRYFKIGASVGISEAMLWLGFVYEEDWNPLKSKKKSFDWFKLAAEANHPEACNRLAVMYEGGVDAPKNLKLAIYWYKKGATLGGVLAQINLALNYEKGVGVRKNLSKALNWYEVAKLQKNSVAIYKVRKIKKELAIR